MQQPTWKGEKDISLDMVVPSCPAWFGFPAVAISPLTCHIIHSLDLYGAFSIQQIPAVPKKDTQLLPCAVRDLSNMIRHYHLLPPMLSS